jgi:hypothetical protein
MTELIITAKRLEVPTDTDGTRLATPVIVERRQVESCGGLCSWSAAGSSVIFLLLLFSALGIFPNPMPIAGGRGAAIPLPVWCVWIGMVALMKIAAHRKESQKWCCLGARVAFGFWTAFTISVWLPGQPVMSWAFGPLLMLAEGMLYVKLCRKKQS